MFRAWVEPRTRTAPAATTWSSASAPGWPAAPSRHACGVHEDGAIGGHVDHRAEAAALERLVHVAEDHERDRARACLQSVGEVLVAPVAVRRRRRWRLPRSPHAVACAPVPTARRMRLSAQPRRPNVREQNQAVCLWSLLQLRSDALRARGGVRHSPQVGVHVGLPLEALPSRGERPAASDAETQGLKVTSTPADIRALQKFMHLAYRVKARASAEPRNSRPPEISPKATNCRSVSA
jgi:hypothetical protein